MDQQLPDRQAAASEAGKILIQHPYDQLLGAAFSPHWFSSSTPTTVYLKIPPSSSWSLQTTPHWSTSFRMVTSLLTDRRLRSWLPGAVLTTWSITCSKLWRWSWTSGEPPCTPATHHHEQHCDCSGIIQIHGQHHLPGSEMGQSHRLHCKKGPAEAVLPSSAEEVQPTTGAAEKVLHCHRWIRPLHNNNCLVQISYKIWPQKASEGSLDCWANDWYTPPHSPRTVLIQSEQKGWKKSLWTPHIQHTPSLNCCHLVDAAVLWAPERPDTEIISSLKQSISWTLDNNYGTHNVYTHTLIYLTHILSLQFNWS